MPRCRLSFIPVWALSALCLAQSPRALGPWTLKNPFGDQFYERALIFGDELVTPTTEGLVRIQPDGTWQRLTEPFNDPDPGSLPFYQEVCQDGNKGYLYTTKGEIHESTDGRSWSKVFSAPRLENMSRIACRNDTFHVQTGNTAYRGVDGENAWVKIKQDTINVLSDNHVLYALGQTFLVLYDFWLHSPDLGKTWSAYKKFAGAPYEIVATNRDIFMLDKNKIFAYDTQKDSFNLVDSALGRANMIAANGEYLYATIGNEIWRTKDKGAHWEVNGLPQKFATINQLYARVTDGASLITYYDGAYLVSPFQSVPRQVTFGANVMSNGPFVAQGKNLLVYSMNSVAFRSPDGGATWTPIGLVAYHIRDLEANDKAFFAATYSGGLLRSANGGRDWDTVSASLTGSQAYEVTVKGDTVLYLEGKNLHRSFDNGSHWDAQPPGNTAAAFTRMFLLDSDLIAWDSASVFHSSDLGKTWSAGKAFYKGDFHAVDGMQAAVSRGKVFLGISKTLIASADGGRTWDSLTVPPGCWIEAMKGDENALYAGCADTSGILVSTDAGKTWTSRNTGLWNRSPNYLSLSQGTLYLKNRNSAFYSAETAGIVSARPGPEPRLHTSPSRVRPVDARGRSHADFPAHLIPYR